MSKTSKAYKAHVDNLHSLAVKGDEMAAKSLACLGLLGAGWRYGDPDPK